MNRIDNWFITPKKKLLAGDVEYRNGSEAYSSGMSIKNSEKTSSGWIVTTKCGKQFEIELEDFDRYFAKNHYAKTINFLK